MNAEYTESRKKHHGISLVTEFRKLGVLLTYCFLSFSGFGTIPAVTMALILNESISFSRTETMNTSQPRWTALLLMAAFACGPGHAEEQKPSDKTTATETQRELAKDAVESATRKAIEAVLENNRLDLDIRLIGPTSIKVADRR